MKIFRKILICFILCLLPFAFVGCDKRSDKEKDFDYPSSSALVDGNGGLAVRKGNYLYFVNGFKSYKDMTDKKASYTVGGLMLLKLDDNGAIVKNENLLNDDYYIFMSNQLCGFEATNLYIAGDYLYFTTPCLEDASGKITDDNSNWAKERVVFNRIKLDKTGKVEKLHQSQVSADNIDFKFYVNGNDAYALVFEKGADIDDDSRKNVIFRVGAGVDKEITRDVESIVMGENANEIFFTKKSDSSVAISRYNILTDQTEQIKTCDDAELQFVGGNFLYYSFSNDSNKDLNKININASSNQYKAESEVYYNIDQYDSYYLAPNSTIVAFNDKKLTLIDTDSVNTNFGDDFEDSDASDNLTFVGFANGVLVYRSGTTFKTFDYVKYATTEVSEVETLIEDEGLETDYFDLEDNYLFIYKTIGSNKYLVRVKIIDSNNTAEMIGVYVGEDQPSEE